MKLPNDVELEACSIYSQLHRLAYQLDFATPEAVDLVLALVARDSTIEEDGFTSLYQYIINNIRTTTWERTNERQS